MKKTIKCLALILAILALTGMISVTAEEVASTDTKAEKTVFSTMFDVQDALGLGGGGATGHGNYQTRIVRASSGVYFTLAGADNDTNEGLFTRIGLGKILDDGSVVLLHESVMEGMRAGASPQAMVDNEGNVWYCVSWDQGSGFYKVCAFCYNPTEGKTTEYIESLYVKKGNNYGKSGFCYDPAYNRIYLLTLGGMSPGWLMWTHYDCTTRAWDKTVKVIKVDSRADYHYMYATGNGGFVSICERCLATNTAPTDIAGLTCQEAYRTLHTGVDKGYVWDDSRMIYIPDATQSVGYNLVLQEAVFNANLGLFPNDWNSDNELWFDEATGYLYAIVSLEDSGTPGYVKNLIVIDLKHPNATDKISTEGAFPIVARTVVYSEYGAKQTYSQKFFKDTLGNIYLINFMGTNHVEIWQAKDNNLATEYVLIYDEIAPTSGYNPSGYTSISISGRSNSVMTDTAAFLIHHGTWEYFTIDFAALREVIKR